MGCATMDFTDLGDVTGASFPQVSKLEDQQLIPELRNQL